MNPKPVLLWLIVVCTAFFALAKYGNDVPVKPSALFSSVANALKALQPDPWSFERRVYSCYEIDYWDAPYIPNRPKQRCVLVRVAP